MCGRARCSLGREEVANAAGVPAEKWKDYEKYLPKYNLGPGSRVPIVRKEEKGEACVQPMAWGLVPSWTKKDDKLDFFRMFNARSETVSEKAVFSRLLGSKRCIVLLNGFYEWAQEHKVKQPYYVHLQGDRITKMAGLYDSWQDAEGNWLSTFTILTTDSSKKLQWLHDRMPVILPDKEAEEAWLQDGPLDMKCFAALCTPYNGVDLQWHPVTTAMSKPDFQGPECCKPLKRQNIASFFKPKTGKAPGITREVKTEDAAAPETDAKASTPVKVEAKAEEKPAAPVGPICAETESSSPAEAVGQKRRSKASEEPGQDAVDVSQEKAEGVEGAGSQKTSKRKKGSLDSFFIKNPA